MLALQSLHVYPTKSCLGATLDKVVISGYGLAGDRLMMFTKPDGSFLTQRAYPKMAKIGLFPAENGLVLHWEGQTEIFDIVLSGERSVTVWQDEMVALDLGDEISNRISQLMGMHVRVVQVGDKTERFVDRNYSPDRVSFGFADGFPFLITSTSSLEDLNQKLSKKGHPSITMDRFRPNIVISGLRPYEEDEIKRLKIGDAVFKLLKPCTRCRITTIDPETLRIGPEPLKTLLEYRYNDKLKGACFGQNAILESGFDSMIHVGDQVEILN